MKVFGTVNPNLKGQYTLTYSVKDAAGNVATASRIVQVINQADPLGGSYSSVSDSIVLTAGSASYSSSIRTDSYTNNLVHFGKFGNYVVDSTVTGLVSGPNETIITVPAQTVYVINGITGTLVREKHTFQGTASDTTGLIIATVIRFTYTDKDSLGNSKTHYSVWRP